VDAWLVQDMYHERAGGQGKKVAWCRTDQVELVQTKLAVEDLWVQLGAVEDDLRTVRAYLFNGMAARLDQVEAAVQASFCLCRPQLQCPTLYRSGLRL
jgi:hypothetical protein